MERKGYLSQTYFWLQKIYKVDTEYELRSWIKNIFQAHSN